MLAVRRKPLSAPLLVRRGKPLQPTPRCREAAGIRFRGGDGLRPAGLLLRERDLQQWVLVALWTSSTAKRSPFSYKEKA